MNPDNLPYYLAGAVGLTVLAAVAVLECDRWLARFAREKLDTRRANRLVPACRHIYPVHGCKDCQR